jgi:pyruvate carboxylase
LIVRYLTTGEVRDDGTRTVFFELNGQPRSVVVADRSVAAKIKPRPKAETDNANHIAAPMPGKVSSVAVKAGQSVKTGERLLSIQAMKMETAVYSPRDAVVAEVDVEPGAVVEARDLLIVLKD